jgi:hypothetical protein
MEFNMFKSATLVALLTTASLVMATPSQPSAVIADDEPVVMDTVSENTWMVAAAAPAAGMTKVREFHDMGDAGVQQIDYVVNCKNRQLSMASFKILTEMASASNAAQTPALGELSFYRPVIQHDINIVDNVCGGKLALGAARIFN